MSIKIPLFFTVTEEPELVKSGISTPVIRLKTLVRFETLEETVISRVAIIDTSAPLSLLPYKIWKKCKVRKIGKSILKGVIPKKECILQVDVGDVVCYLITENGGFEEVSIRAYLPKTDKLPVILGFEKILENFTLFINYLKKEAFLEKWRRR